jgi:hypothetical protein
LRSLIKTPVKFSEDSRAEVFVFTAFRVIPNVTLSGYIAVAKASGYGSFAVVDRLEK